MLCSVFEGNFQVQAPGDLYSEGRLNGGFFCVTSLGGGLYLDGLIHGGAYFRNFTVFMNDLVYVIKRSNLSTYPDDTQIFFADKGPVIVQETINSDLSYVDKWFLEKWHEKKPL